MLWLAGTGVALAILGLALDPLLPINKKLWTSSYALLSSGLSAVLLVLCTLAIRTRTVERILTPLHILGMNAILGYILSLLIGLAGMRLGFQAWGFAAIERVLPSLDLASFGYALTILLVVLAALLPLHRRGIHLRL
ncbi:hypothetical protein BH09PSE4_BH09PSE4_16540 [soil metagenome]